MAKKRKSKKRAKGRAKPAPTLKMAMDAIQREKGKGGKSNAEWHMLSAAEGILRKLGA